MINTIGLSLLYIFSFSWTIPAFFGKVFGFNLYKISSQDIVQLIRKKLPKRSTVTIDDDISGWIFGWPYVGYIEETFTSAPSIYLYTTKKFYENIINKNDKNDKNDKNGEKDKKEKSIKINLWCRDGSFTYFYYTKRLLDITRYQPRKNQAEIIEIIKNYYDKNNNYVVVFIHGKPGSGKSMIPLLLAKELNADICDTFNPTDPGDSFNKIYNKILPTKENPMIVVIEEADIMINNVHKNTIKKHKRVPIQIIDKTSMNQFFDKIDRGVYPYLFFIMTSNTPVEEINKLDPSYLRDGRVNLRIELKPEF